METTLRKYIETYGLFPFQAPLLMLILVSKYIDKLILAQNKRLLAALEVSQLLQSTGFAYSTLSVTGNVKSVQTFRKVIKSKTNAKIKHHGYWLEGKKGL